MLFKRPQAVEAHLHLAATPHRLTHSCDLPSLNSDDLPDDQFHESLEVADESAAKLSRAVRLEGLIGVRQQVVFVCLVGRFREAVGFQVEIHGQRLENELEKEPRIFHDHVLDSDLIVSAFSGQRVDPFG